MWAWSTGLPSQCVNILLTAPAHKKHNHQRSQRALLVAHANFQFRAHSWNNGCRLFLTVERLHARITQTLDILMWNLMSLLVSNSINVAPTFCVYSPNSTTLRVCIWIPLNANPPTFDGVPEKTFANPDSPVFPRHACLNVSYDTARLRRVALNTRATSCSWRSHVLAALQPHGRTVTHLFSLFTTWT